MRRHSVQPNASFVPWICQLVATATLFIVIVADPVSGQGPIRRLGDRIRERALGPELPLPPRPGALPATPLPTEAPPIAGPLRLRLNRQPITPPNASQTSPRSPAVPLASPNPTAQQPGAGRSANFSRAGRAAPDDRANRNIDGTSAAPEARQSQAGQNSAPAAWQTRQRDVSADTTPSAAPKPAEPLAINPPKARLGIVVETPPEITPAGLPPRRPRGALVVAITPESPADFAGLVIGDLIVAVEGRIVASVQDLTDHLENRLPGDELRFQFNRNDQLQAATVTLAGADGIAIKRPNTSSGNGSSTSGTQSILGSFGTALGGLFGSAPDSASNNRQPPAVERPGSSAPETLPPPVPEPNDESEDR